MSETVVRQHVRAKPNGGIAGVRRHMRYLTTEDIAAGRGRGVGRSALGDDLIRRGAAEGYAADGPWEVERRDNDLVLLHYAFPIARAKFNESVGWEIGKIQGRPGYGMSRSDVEGARFFSAALRSSDDPESVRNLKVGLNPDPRLRGRRGPFGSRVSPYARVDERRVDMWRSMGIKGTPHIGAVPFVARRGRRVPIRKPT